MSADDGFSGLGHRLDGIHSVKPSGLSPALFRRFPPIVYVGKSSIPSLCTRYPYVCEDEAVGEFEKAGNMELEYLQFRQNLSCFYANLQ